MPEYTEITREELTRYQPLILPMVYEELEAQEEIGSDYICIACCLGGEPAGAIIAEPEGNGDLNLLSIWTDPRYRRMGVASALRDKMTQVAVSLYDWDDGQYGDDVLLKTMYALSDRYREPFEAWLEKNDFTDFGILTEPSADTPAIRSASAEIHFFRTDSAVPEI